MSSTRQAHSTDLPISRHSLDMKLILVLSLVAYGYADKLDRTYLPPPGAATAGGSPGSLSAPGQGFGQQAPGFRGSQSQPGSFDTNGPSQPTGPSGFGNAGSFGRPGSNQPAGNGFGRPSGQGAFQPSGTGVQPPASQTGFGGQGQGFNQPQQPERPQASADRNAEILRYDNQNDGETFSYNFETSNGISAEESGVATNGVQAQGGFSYTGDDGQFYKITYTADENGYLPQGDHLPTPPPIPDEILRSIEENARAAASGTQEGAYNPDEDNSPQYNGNQGQQQFRGSNGFEPSGSAGQPSGPQGSGFNQGSQGSLGFNQGAQGPQGSFNQGAPQGQGFNQGSAAGNGNTNQGISGQRAQGGQAGYDYSRPQNQPSSRQPNGNANTIPTGPFKASGSQNQGRPFNQNQQGQSGSQGRPFQQTTGSAANQRQYLAPDQRQPGNQGSAPQSFNQPQGPRQPGQGSGAQGQFNQNQGPRQSGQGPATQGQYNQNQGSGSQSSRGPSTFGQSRPTNQQQGFSPQRGSQGAQGPRGQANGGQDGYEYNRPQNGFNAGSQSRPQGPNVSRPQASLPGSGSQGQSGFPGSQSQTGFPSRPASQGAQGFPGAKGQGQFGQQPQRPSNQESFSGPRQPPSFSPEEGYKY